MTDWYRVSAAGLAAAYAREEVSPVEVLELPVWTGWQA